MCVCIWVGNIPHICLSDKKKIGIPIFSHTFPIKFSMFRNFVHYHLLQYVHSDVYRDIYLEGRRHEIPFIHITHLNTFITSLAFYAI